MEGCPSPLSLSGVNCVMASRIWKKKTNPFLHFKLPALHERMISQSYILQRSKGDETAETHAHMHTYIPCLPFQSPPACFRSLPRWQPRFTFSFKRYNLSESSTHPLNTPILSSSIPKSETYQIIILRQTPLPPSLRPSHTTPQPSSHNIPPTQMYPGTIQT